MKLCQYKINGKCEMPEEITQCPNGADDKCMVPGDADPIETLREWGILKLHISDWPEFNRLLDAVKESIDNRKPIC